MPIVQLQPEQITQLREAVITTFLVRTNKKTFQYTTFKDKYKEIQKDILNLQ